MQNTEYEILFYFGFWQLVVCLYAFLGLLAIWYHIGRKQEDFGQVWLALSILCWSLSGLAEVVYMGPLRYLMVDNVLGGVDPFAYHKEQKLLLDGWKSILSLLNSLFILLALPWFKHIPKFLEQTIKSKFWPLIVGLPFVFSLLPTLSKLFSNSQLGLISELDVYYSILTLGILGLVLWESFSKRRLTALAYLSSLCILITFLAQIFKLTESGINQILFSAIFKTSLIMMFFALALSWVKDLTEKISIKPSDLTISLLGDNDSEKLKNLVSLNGLLHTKNHPFSLTNKNYTLLALFLSKRKETTEGWLDIKPKSEQRSGRIYDINDHNEVKRLHHAILDGLYGKQLWSRNEHEIPLREILFEMSPDRERKIRIRIPSSNIHLD